MDNAYLDKVEWNEAEANAELFRGLILLFASGPDGQPRPIGTGFIIKSEGRRAWAISAAHVLSEVRRLQSGAPRHNRTALDIFLPPPKAVDIDRKKLWAMTRAGDEVHVLIVTGVAFDEKTDIAFLTLAPMSAEAPSIPLQEFSPSAEVPPVGAPICVLSFGDLATQDFQKDGDAWRLEISMRPVLRAGRVIAHHYDGNRLCKGPCIETSIPVFSGMSGGPVFALGSSGPMKPFALVCSDPDPDGPQKQERLIAGASIMALLPVKVVPLPDNAQHSTFIMQTEDYAGDMAPENMLPSYRPQGIAYLTEHASTWTFRFRPVTMSTASPYAAKWKLIK